MLEQDAGAARSQEAARLKKEIKRLGMVNAGREARGRSATGSELSSLRVTIDARKRSSEQAHIQAHSTQSSLRDEIANISTDNESLTTALQETEKTITQLSGLAAAQAAQLRRLRIQLQTEKTAQLTLKPQPAPQPIRMTSWSPKYRTGSHPALMRNNCPPAALYFPTIMQRSTARLS